MPPVFISYTKEDSARVKALAAALRRLDRSTWIYEDDSDGGMSYVQNVCRAISSSCAVVLIASRASVRSKNVLKEVEFAHEEDRIVIPVLLDISLEDLKAAHDIFKFVVGTTVAMSGADVAELASQIDKALRLRGESRHASSATPTVSGHVTDDDTWLTKFLNAYKEDETRWEERTCLFCNGSGRWASVQKHGKWNKCKKCDGTGRWKFLKNPPP